MMWVRYAMESVMLLPAAVFALLPVRKHLHISRPAVYGTAVLTILLFTLAETFFRMKFGISANAVLLPIIPIFFTLYCAAVDMGFAQKLWCFLNAVMLCAFGRNYTVYVTAPEEQFNFLPVTRIETTFINFGIDLFVVLLFYRTLTVQIPYLLESPFFEKLWWGFSALPAVASLLFIWSTPINNSFVMTGRLRPIAMVFYLVLLAIILAFYYLIFMLTRHIVTQTELEDTNNLLQMEEKRYLELRSYIDQTRTLRHDFRQYVILLQHYLDEGDLEALHRSLQKYDTVLTGTQVSYCENRMVDAVIAHYVKTAQQKETKMKISMHIPENVPVRVSDLCVVLGNLLENALRAVEELPAEKREIKLRAKMLTDEMIGIMLENPYAGTILLDRRGIPRTTSANREHGIGLRSVFDTVKRYQGDLRFETNEQVFRVELTMFGQKDTMQTL